MIIKLNFFIENVKDKDYEEDEYYEENEEDEDYEDDEEY